MIGSPTAPLAPAERRRIGALVAAYRLAGPRPFATTIVDALLSPSAPSEAVTLVRAAFLGGDRVGMHRVMRAMMLGRRDLGDRLPRITAPTLLVAGADDETWAPEQARRTGATLTDGRVLVMDGTGHIPPLERPDETAAAILELWQAGVSPPARGTPADSHRGAV